MSWIIEDLTSLANYVETLCYLVIWIRVVMIEKLWTCFILITGELLLYFYNFLPWILYCLWHEKIQFWELKINEVSKITIHEILNIILCKYTDSEVKDKCTGSKDFILKQFSFDLMIFFYFSHWLKPVKSNRKVIELWKMILVTLFV